ncbi:MAG TPA: hypothetical protein VJU16_02915 [Planctomycetota bacterium]|nr:hypothetical protein [Planctomycetota bacterium]
MAYRESLSDSKPGISTLRLTDLAGKESKALVEKAEIQTYEWSPKGDRLACGLQNEIRFLEVPSGKLLKRFEWKDIHKNLTNHAASGMIWRADGGAIACKFNFQGKPAKGAKFFGDDELFILPLEGSPVVIEAGGEAWPVRWTR